MHTTIYAPAAGVIGEVLITPGDSIDSGDLLFPLK